MNGALAKPIDCAEVFNALALYGRADEKRRAERGDAGQGADITAAKPDTADIVTSADEDHAIDLATLDRLRHLGATLTVEVAELIMRDTERRLQELHEAVRAAAHPPWQRSHTQSEAAPPISGLISWPRILRN